MGKISIEKLAEMVKNGFNQMATKEALKALATKEDLKAFATKEDLQNGLDGVETRLINQFDDFRDNIRKIKTKIEME